MKPLVATVAVLVALATGAPVQAQTPELDELRALGEQGDPEAFCNIGTHYKAGIGVPKDYAVAVEWYLRLADRANEYSGVRGSPQRTCWCLPARSVLTELYQEGGFGIRQDYVTALMWANLTVAVARADQGWVRSGPRYLNIVSQIEAKLSSNERADGR